MWGKWSRGATNAFLLRGHIAIIYIMSSNTPDVPYTEAETQRESVLTAGLTGLDDFRLTNIKQITSTMRQLATRGDFMTVTYGLHGQRIVSRILHVDEEEGCFYYDLAPTNPENDALLSSDEQLFAANPGGIHVQFVSYQPRMDKYDGLPALRSVLPEALYRMQRRENFRVETPVANPFTCEATLPDGRRMHFEVSDISLTGIRLRGDDPSLEELVIGTPLRDAFIDCQSMGSIITDMSVAFLRNHRTLADPLFHVGCRFDNLPARREADLQKMITYLEITRNRR